MPSLLPSTSATLAATIRPASWISVTGRIRAFLSILADAPKPMPISERALFHALGPPSLKPESSKTWTTGIEQMLLNDRIRLSAEYFSSRFYNIVSFAFCTPITATTNTCGVTIPGAPPSFGFFFNTDRARTRGVNLAGETRLSRWLNLAGNYTYDDSRILAAPNAFDPTGLPGNHLARRPVHSGSLTLNAAYRSFGITVGGYFSGV